MTSASTGRWAQRASALYDERYARRYRGHDEELVESKPRQAFADWLGDTCAMFTPPIDVLDLGCGTGRYFSALSGVGRLVGIDASAPMLAEARHPFQADRVTATSVTLVEGDLFTHECEARSFDLVYSIGVLAEHAPLDETIVARVARWLKPGGRFAFSTVDPESASIPQTWTRRLARAIAPSAPSDVSNWIRRRMLSGGLYADERSVRELLESRFVVESIRHTHSEAHLHCLCVARLAGRD